MTESSTIGTRIRQRRLSQGMRQSALAEVAGISPSYLNLIEHNRRRIGGKLLLLLAEALGVEPTALSQGGEAALMEGLRDVARQTPRDPAATAPELDRLEEFAGRFPGWAQLLAQAHQQSEQRARLVQSLTDRLAHDPHLAESLHEVLSVVTAIRSTASILVETRQLEPEWQARFHRNINEDSQRLAEGAESLVQYLDAVPGSASDIRSPQEEMDQFLAAHDYHFDALEVGGGGDVDAILSASDVLTLPAARQLCRAALAQYRADAALIPLDRLRTALGETGLHSALLAQRFDVDLPVMLRRLAFLPVSDVGPVGLVIVDGAGAILLRRPLDGFAMTRPTGSCPLWPVFRVLSQPGGALEQHLIQPTRDARRVVALACAMPVGPPVVNAPPLLRGVMLLWPAPEPAPEDDAPRQEVQPVGTSCRICARAHCVARREPSVLEEAAP
ncbi:short-chain fatty acyl-CoA regulator family protein [Rhodobacteraceae bacterium KMM 6894]|nr:short-chain fatty acyl-CoA regulator family protein [Rhodobacteraceae bacterium KMM 6894]